MRYTFIVTLLLLATFAHAQQLKVPTLSPFSEIKQEVGLTDITLSYARPSAKGRKVFGELVPFGEMWRTGANASTKLTVSETVKIAGNELAAGTYALYTIPNEKEWTIIVHKKTNFRSISGDRVKPENDAFRFQVQATASPLYVETFTIQFTDLHTKGCQLQLAWANTLVTFPIEMQVDEQIDSQIANLLVNSEEMGHFDYFRAAEYYLHNEKDLDQAQTWIDAALQKSENNFRYGLLKSKIYTAQGKMTEAIQTVTTANEWATEAENNNYIGQTEVYLKSITPPKKPKATLTNLSGKEVLAKSIQYHDPKGNWATFNATLYLEQKSPKSPDPAKSEFVLDLPNRYFKAIDRRNGVVIQRELNGEECHNTLAGTTEISEEDQKKYRLTCERAKMYRNYYAYLYGLPMKLKDAGTIIDKAVYATSFQGKECLSIRVTYAEAVGDDIWYFYFDKNSYALIGYRFYHEEEKNDGEYITLEGEIVVQGIKIPQNRHWYYNKDDKFLAADLLIKGVGLRK